MLHGCLHLLFIIHLLFCWVMLCILQRVAVQTRMNMAKTSVQFNKHFLELMNGSDMSLCLTTALQHLNILAAHFVPPGIP